MISATSMDEVLSCVANAAGEAAAAESLLEAIRSGDGADEIQSLQCRSSTILISSTAGILVKWNTECEFVKVN